MTTVAIDDDTRYRLGFINNGNENLGDTISRLVQEEVKRQNIKIPVKQ